MSFPSTLFRAINYFKFDHADETQLFIVCPNVACNALFYPHTTGKCTARNYGKVCGESLGYYSNLKYIPYKKFEFFPPSETLKKFFCNDKFTRLLERRATNCCPDIIHDISDGNIWKKFEDAGFFSTQYNLVLMLNIDWFRPHKRSKYKVAAIMLSILNLPREERFKKKWTILAGINFPK